MRPLDTRQTGQGLVITISDVQDASNEDAADLAGMRAIDRGYHPHYYRVSNRYYHNTGTEAVDVIFDRADQEFQL